MTCQWFRTADETLLLVNAVTLNTFGKWDYHLEQIANERCKVNGDVIRSPKDNGISAISHRAHCSRETWESCRRLLWKAKRRCVEWLDQDALSATGRLANRFCRSKMHFEWHFAKIEFCLDIELWNSLSERANRKLGSRPIRAARLPRAEISRFAANDDSNFGQLEAIVLLANFANLLSLNVPLGQIEFGRLPDWPISVDTSFGQRMD